MTGRASRSEQARESPRQTVRATLSSSWELRCGFRQDGGQKFAQLAAVVATIEEQLVRRARARAEARKVKIATRRSALGHMKAMASTGRQAAGEETGVHPLCADPAR